MGKSSQLGARIHAFVDMDATVDAANVGVDAAASTLPAFAVEKKRETTRRSHRLSSHFNSQNDPAPTLKISLFSDLYDENNSRIRGCQTGHYREMEIRFFFPPAGVDGVRSTERARRIPLPSAPCNNFIYPLNKISDRLRLSKTAARPRDDCLKN